MGGKEEGKGTMTMKKKKKKGRPSLLDLQIRSLKQQQHHHQSTHFKNPNSHHLSHSTSLLHLSAPRNPTSNASDFINDNGDDDDDERTQKKHKLLLGLNASEIAVKRRKISTGSDQLGQKVLKVTDALQESSVEPGPTTPLPDKKLLVFILDRLQKKDTYGVFSEPADPEELPDYHDIIEHPMDFSTVRKKLDGGAYANLEPFEKDVFLICSNAMQYNSPDTIYFRQARSMQELAKKDFENLRQESDDGEPQPKVVRRGRPPGKKKSMEKSPLDSFAPECSSDATLASGADNANLSAGYNLRRTYSYKYQPTEVLVRNSHGSHSNDTYATWMSEWENEFPASVLKAVLKYGKKPYAVDENRRDTYKPLALAHGPATLNIFELELKQLMAVGLNSEYGYARSLARFAAALGPAVRKIASKKIESALPPGLEFGPGWVGEGKGLDLQQRLLSSDRQNVSSISRSNDHLNVPQSSATAATSAAASRCLAWSREDVVENTSGSGCQRESTCVSNSIGGSNRASSVVVQQKPIIHSDINGLSGGFGYSNCPPIIGSGKLGISTGKPTLEHNAVVPDQELGMVPAGTSTLCPVPEDHHNLKKDNFSESSNGIFHSENSPSLGSCPDLQRLLNPGVGGKLSWQRLSPYHQQELFQFQPDLNVGFLAPKSPGSSVPIGSPQHPDLALQL